MKRIVLLALIMLVALAVFAGTALADPPRGSFGECNKGLAGNHKNIRCVKPIILPI
jgi:hypothetical protein